jgi:hypothetical protein
LQVRERVTDLRARGKEAVGTLAVRHFFKHLRFATYQFGANGAAFFEQRGFVFVFEEKRLGEKNGARFPTAFNGAEQVAVTLDEHEAEFVAVRALAEFDGFLHARVREACDVQINVHGSIV